MSNESPYAPPKSTLINPDNSAVSRKRRFVILNPDAAWPSRCFKCNKNTDQRKRVKLTYLNPWIYLSIFVTILLTIILALIFRKKFTLNFPLCDLHLQRRKNFFIFQWAMVLVVTAAFAVAFVNNSDGWFLVAISIFLLVIFSALFGRLAFAAKYKDGNLWITGAGKAFLNSLPEFSD